jgi:nucleotide sugar dehydrogenase
MTVTVVGLGKIGLPLAVQFALKGQKVLGADLNPLTVQMVNTGIEPFPEEENLQEYLESVVKNGSLQASTSTTECVSLSNVVIVVVPLFVDEFAEPDFRSMDSATIDIAKGLKPGTLVIYETTLPIGTTRNRFGKMLEEYSGLKVGIDFSLVFSPERVLTGRVFKDLRKYPKIVGGVNIQSGEKAAEFYGQVLDFDLRDDLDKPNGVWQLDSCESAEFVKLAETTYRDVNIGLANQFAMYSISQGLNIHEIIQAANSQPYSRIHEPGIAVGGHCIPIYPQFYLWNDSDATIVAAAREANESMPGRAIDLIQSAIGSVRNKEVLILGASYRSGVKETAFSGVFPLVAKLLSLEAKVEVFDPLYSNEEISELGLTPNKDFTLKQIVIIQNSDPQFIALLSSNQLFPKLELIMDGRNLLEMKPLFGIRKEVKVIGL